VNARLLPGQPAENAEPVFREPWDAQAFALAVKLCEAGHFTWSEWAEALGAEIAAARAAGDPDLGDTYYRHRLKAWGRLVREKGLGGRPHLAARRAAWAQADRETPLGLHEVASLPADVVYTHNSYVFPKFRGNKLFQALLRAQYLYHRERNARYACNLIETVNLDSLQAHRRLGNRTQPARLLKLPGGPVRFVGPSFKPRWSAPR